MKIINALEIQKITSSNIHLFNSFQWLKVISNTYGIEFKAVFDESSKHILPFCLLNDKYFSSVKSIPFGDYTLIHYPNEFLIEVLSLLRKTYPERYIETTVVNSTSPHVEDYTSLNTGFLIQIDIGKWKESSDWKDTYERNIRNALNYGLAVKVSASLDSLTGFYKLHEQLRINKFKKLPQPFHFFTNIFNELIIKKKGFFLEAWNKDILIASWLILENNDILYYKFGASDLHSLNLRPNDLLFRSLMQIGNDREFQTVDLGFSGASKEYEGLIRFKSKEGGQKIPIFHLEYFPEGFDKTLMRTRTNYLKNITEKAIDSNDINVIIQTSNHDYHRFA